MKSTEAYRVEDVAARLGISRGLAYSLVRSGKIPSIRLNRRFVIPRDLFEKWLAEEVERSAAASR